MLYRTCAIWTIVSHRQKMLCIAIVRFDEYVIKLLYIMNSPWNNVELVNLPFCSRVIGLFYVMLQITDTTTTCNLKSCSGNYPDLIPSVIR